MKNYKIVLLPLLWLVFFSSQVQAFAKELTWYDEPLKYNNSYINDVEQVILAALHQRQWDVKEKSSGSILAWLDDYKGYELILEITYSDSLISFKQKSYRKVDCTKRCTARQKYADKWRLYLRKSIAMNIHTLAMDNLLKNDEIRVSWLDILKNGSIENKIKFARNIIDLNYYNEDVLTELSAQVSANYLNTHFSSAEVQQYAFFCKALTLSRQVQYKTLLRAVRDNTNDRKLSNYVRGYLKMNLGV